MDKELKRLRERIDEADRALVEALIERMKAVEGIKQYKENNDLKVRDQKRIDEIFKTRVSMGKRLPRDFVRDIFRLIIEYSERLQR